MAAEKQYSLAKRALDIIGREALAPGKYITYGRFAELLGYDRKSAKPVGQVCSLVDAACYWAKLPMLSLEKVRMDSGDYNPKSFSDLFSPVESQLIANASARLWTEDDIKRIKHYLEHMNMEGAIQQWERIESFGQEGLDRIASTNSSLWASRIRRCAILSLDY
jgi:hypothetical protein